MKIKRIVHPFLFAIYPVLFLFSQNIVQVPFSETWVPIIISLGLTLILLALNMLVFRDIERAGMLTSLFLILFFSNGHVVNVLNQWGNNNQAYLLLLYGCIISLGISFLKKTQRQLYYVSRALNVMASCLLLFSLVTIGVSSLKTGIFRQSTAGTKNIENNPIKTVKTTQRPNIYYIILDAYARQDVLKEIFDYNNAIFIMALERKGFYVAGSSAANYSFTQLSLASSLNFSYFNTYAKHIGAENTSYFPLYEAILNNRTSALLKSHGYEAKFVFTAGTGLESFASADIYILGRNYIWLANAFHQTVLNSTPIPYVFSDILASQFDEFDFHRRQVLYAFDKIEALSRKKGPHLVFAHIIKPHVPFVFSETGKPITPHHQYGLWYSVRKGMDRDEYLDLYKKQLYFINKKIMALVDNILSNSSRPPIIILQSDHGPVLGERFSLADTNLNILLPILNAYYLPNGGKKHLYPAISPVNTFRVIFNHYFNMDMDLLPDESYYALPKYPYKYYKVTDMIREED